MKIEKVSYQEAFPIDGYGTYLQRKGTIDIILEEGDTIAAALDHAKRELHNWNEKQNAPTLQFTDMPEVGMTFVSQRPAVIDIQDEKKLASIDNATTLEELATLKPGLPQHLMPDYMKKLKSLTT